MCYRNLSLPRGKVVPSHKRSAEDAELIPGKRFRKDIRNLLFRGYVFNGNGFVDDMRTKMMKSNREMFCSGTSFMVLKIGEATVR